MFERLGGSTTVPGTSVHPLYVCGFLHAALMGLELMAPNARNACRVGQGENPVPARNVLDMCPRSRGDKVRVIDDVGNCGNGDAGRIGGIAHFHG